MHGNVWEWTASWFFDDPEAGRDPNAVGRSRVLRGGSFHDIPVDCRSAFRGLRHPAGIVNDDGFRAARAKLTR
jgi:formylglycine-generating enzyme required for sulfatase activity